MSWFSKPLKRGIHPEYYNKKNFHQLKLDLKSFAQQLALSFSLESQS